MAQGETQITLVGNLVADPELRFTPSGTQVANFRIASTPRTYNAKTGEWEDGESMFLTCNVWRKAAENVAESLTKGMRVILTGRLRQRSYETREGERRSVFEVEVDEVGPSLRNATAQIHRNENPGRSGGFNGGGQQSAPRQQAPQQGGFGGGGGQQIPSDPWNSAPAAGGFGGSDDEPPF
ncbi:single-stranded DNA-binding protein [Corynebacterium aquilae]|uniref:Single-stranded DNA-binding protein n=1 Tax=Corynebacterium aquilae DSM 44791 TaxID=1431546 RepID=A0A1L7CIM7_9CORY|nr:single-stranded DNA-binding protein [Corynebacterium aquilae]APT85716.1 single-stranded DNA-binding protein [Corynebacterium aquilae DSM 44791]